MMETKLLMQFAMAQGFTHSRSKGDHAIFTKPGARSVPIPQGSKWLNPGLSRNIIKQLRYSDIDRQQAQIIQDRLLGVD